MVRKCETIKSFLSQTGDVQSQNNIFLFSITCIRYSSPGAVGKLVNGISRLLCTAHLALSQQSSLCNLVQSKLTYLHKMHTFAKPSHFDTISIIAN